MIILKERPDVYPYDELHRDLSLFVSVINDPELSDLYAGGRYDLVYTPIGHKIYLLKDKDVIYDT